MNKNNFLALVAFLAIIGFLIFIFAPKKNEEVFEEYGFTLGAVIDKYCAKNRSDIKFALDSVRLFVGCEEINNALIASDRDNYSAKSRQIDRNYTSDDIVATFYFDVDNSQPDIRPLVVDSPELFVGKSVREVCDTYGLAEFRVNVYGENLGIVSVTCGEDIRGTYDGAVINKYYYVGDEMSDDKEEYYSTNNSKGTRSLVFDAVLSF